MNGYLIAGIACVLLGSYFIYATTKRTKEGKDDATGLSYQGIALGLMFVVLGVALIAYQL
jgi:hypothetical protein